MWPVPIISPWLNCLLHLWIFASIIYDQVGPLLIYCGFQKLLSDRETLEKGDGFPDSYSTEMCRLRQIQLQHQNELMEFEEVGAKLDHEIEKYGLSPATVCW